MRPLVRFRQCVIIVGPPVTNYTEAWAGRCRKAAKFLLTGREGGNGGWVSEDSNPLQQIKM